MEDILCDVFQWHDLVFPLLEQTLIDFKDNEEIPCRDVHLARCFQFAMHKFRLSLFVKDLEPGGSTTFCEKRVRVSESSQCSV